MSKQRLTKKKYGWYDFEGLVDITDPCYDRDVWCRINDVKVKESSFECVAWVGEDKRVMRMGIYWMGYVPPQKEMELFGEIGVDSGMAGFFHNKRDYTKEEWAEFCDLASTYETDTFEEGFYSETAFGDGCYNVLCHKDNNGEIDSLEIEF